MRTELLTNLKSQEIIRESLYISKKLNTVIILFQYLRNNLSEDVKLAREKKLRNDSPLLVSYGCHIGFLYDKMQKKNLYLSSSTYYTKINNSPLKKYFCFQ